MRGRTPGLRPRHRAEAQAAPGRRKVEIPRLPPPRRPPSRSRITRSSTAPSENRRALYRESNIPRETALAELGAAVSEAHRRHDRSPSAARNARPRRWPRSSKRPTAPSGRRPGNSSPRGRLADRDALDDLFDRMLALRVEVAREAGFANYVDYSFRNRERFDYSAADTLHFHEAIERVVVPLARKLQEDRRQALGVESAAGPGTSRWIPKGRPPLRPYAPEESGKFAEGTESIFRAVDPDLAGPVRLHAPAGAARPVQPQGEGTRRVSDDARGRPPAVHLHERRRHGWRPAHACLHEGGHAFHALASQGRDRWPPIARAPSSSARSPR